MKSYAIDSSVAVKWFKGGEPLEREALRLRGEVLSSAVKACACELMPLEVCRGLLKAGYPRKKVDETYQILREMSDFGFLKLVPVGELRDRAEELIASLNLYVADAASLAAAFSSHVDMVTEDRHLLKQDVRAALEGEGLRTIRLGELYAGRR